MGNDTMLADFPDQEQRAAVCYRQFRGETSSNALQIVANRIDGTRVESRQRDGREWLVAPVVMIAEGVLNGELVPATEFGRHAGSWNGRPIVLGHPMADGVPVSANDPAILEQYGIGQVFGAEFRENKLPAWAWIDVDRASRTDDGREVVRRLRAGQPIEVSTAYWRDLEPAQGEWNGAQHAGIARNLKPDHLAFLLHDVGACSIEDGCGCPRVNAEGRETMDDVMTGTTAADAPLIIDSRDDADNGHNGGLIQALKQAVTGAFRSFLQEAKMDEKRQAVLEAARSVWDEGTLSALSEDQVEWLHGHLVQAAPVEPATNEAEPAQEPDPEPPALDIRAALDEYLADLGGLDGLKAKLATIKANADAERAEIVARLVGNKRCALSEAQLQKLDTETLEGIEASLRPADYRGQGGGPQANTGEPKIEKVNWTPRPWNNEEVQ